MTIRKANIPLPARPPSYVTRETGSAELMISPETWDTWVDEGRIPPKAPGFPDGTPRWRWADVDRRMAGKSAVEADPFVIGAGKLRDVSQKGRRRDAA